MQDCLRHRMSAHAAIRAVRMSMIWTGANQRACPSRPMRCSMKSLSYESAGSVPLTTAQAKCRRPTPETSDEDCGKNSPRGA